MKRYGMWPAWLFMLAFFFAPLLALIVEASAEGGAAFLSMLGDRQIISAIRNTVLLGLVTAFVSGAIGTMIAIELARQPVQHQRWMLTLLGLPLAFSGLVIAYGFILAFGRAGFVTQLLGVFGADPAHVGAFIYSIYGLAFAYAYYLIPRVALSLFPVFANLDEKPFLAARTLGATRWRAFADTVLPEVAPSVFSASLMVAAIAMGTYGTALALVGTQLNILPLLLLAKVSDGGSDFPAAAAMSLVLLALCLLFLTIGDLVSQRKGDREHFAS